MRKKRGSEKLKNTLTQGATASRSPNADLLDSKPISTVVRLLSQAFHSSSSLRGGFWEHRNRPSREMYLTKCLKHLYYFIWVFRQLHLLMMSHRPRESSSPRRNAFCHTPACLRPSPAMATWAQAHQPRAKPCSPSPQPLSKLAL